MNDLQPDNMSSKTDFKGPKTYNEWYLEKGATAFSYKKLQSPSHFRIFMLLPQSYVHPLLSAPQTAIYSSLLETSTEKECPMSVSPTHGVWQLPTSQSF